MTNRPALSRFSNHALQALTEAHPQVTWVESPCPLCGSDSSEPWLEAADPLPENGRGLIFGIVRCLHCGLKYTNPRPDEATIASFYPTDYQPHRRPRKLRQSRAPRPLWSRLFGRPCPERRGVLPWPKPGRLLDFGCGAGSYLQTMAEQGWQVTGLDAAVGAVSHARAEGHTALVGTLPHPELKPGSFDIVTMWHSLEHLHRPVAVLREAYRLLVPGGKLIVATPNIESIPFRIFQQSWFGLDLPRHLTHFTHSTLTAMLQTAGFRTEKVRQLRHSDWLRSSAKQAARAKTGGLFSMLVSLKPVSRLAAWACYALGGSDCIVCVAERPR